MKTTLEIPDDLLRESKAKAALEGIRLKDLIARSLKIEVRGHVQSGKVRALAVTSAKRSKVLPEVPTLQEAGIAGFDVASWQAIYAPAGTPAPVVQRLNAEIGKILASAEVKAKMDGLGLDHVANTPEQFAAFGRSELAKWQKVVKDGNVKPE